MKRYVYFFTRQDIFPEYQLVQTAHAALKLGHRCKELCPDNTYFTCCGARNLEALIAIVDILNKFEIQHELFFEPDLNDGELTSIALYPIDEDKRGILMAFDLLKFPTK